MPKPTIGQPNWGADLNEHLDAIEATAGAALPASEKGAANGVAPLDAGSRVPEANLPAYAAEAALSATYGRRHMVNVADYDAVGDWNGTTGTDNLAAFDAAVTEAQTSGQPASILIPAGRFWLSDGWELDGDNIEVIASPDAEIITTSATTLGATVTFMGHGVQTPDNAVGTPQRFRASWRGGTITATGSAGLDNALGFVRYEKVWASDVVLDADRKGITAQYGVDEVDWDRVIVTRAGDDAISVETDCNRVRVRGFHVESATGRGVLVTGSTTARCSDVNVLDGVVTSAGGTGVSIQYADRVSVERVHVAASAAGFGLGLAEATKVSIGAGCNFPTGITYGANVTSKTPRSVTVTPSSGWVAFGAPHATPRAFKTADGMIVLSGAMKSGTTTAGTKIGSLPVGYRPDSRERFIAQQAGGADTAADLYVDSSGDILIAKTLTSNIILSLSGVTFPAV